MQVRECDRCESKIAEPNYARNEPLRITRNLGTDEYEHRDAIFCSMCWDDLWEWAFGETPDRSDVADPLPLEKAAESVERHIDDLENVIGSLRDAGADA